MNVTTTAIAATPTTLLVLAAAGGATAQITNANPEAVGKVLKVTSIALIASAIATRNVAVVVATGSTIAIVAYATRTVWPWGVHVSDD